MDKIDLALKDFLEKGKFVKTRTTLSAETPSTEDLCRFIRDELETIELERILNHLKTHPEDEVLVTQARELLSRLQEADSQKAPAAAVARAQGLMGHIPTLKCPHCGKLI